MGGVGDIMLFMRKTSVDSERERERKKKRQHILSQTPLVTAFVTRKQDFFSPSPAPFFFFFPCIYNTYRTRLLNCEDSAGSSL